MLLGYSNISSFTTAFKSWYNMPPAEYRQKFLALLSRSTAIPGPGIAEIDRLLPKLGPVGPEIRLLFAARSIEDIQCLRSSNSISMVSGLIRSNPGPWTS